MEESRYFVTVKGRSFPVTVREGDGKLEVALDGKSVGVDLCRVRGTPLWSLLIENTPHKAVMVREGERWFLDLDGVSEYLEIGTDRDRILRQFAPKEAKRSGTVVVVSPMPGLVTAVKVKEGDAVAVGQGVATVEAMKMENEFKAADAGVVEKVHVSAGASVPKGAPIVTIRIG